MSTYRMGGSKCPRCRRTIWFEGSTPNCDCVPCECCGEPIAPSEVRHFQGWQVCADCLEILQEEKNEIGKNNPNIKALLRAG